MSTVDYSQLTSDQIQDLLAQRRAELTSIQAVAKEKGVSIPRVKAEPKADVAPDDQLRAGIRRVARGQFRTNDEQARLDRAQAAYTKMLGEFYPQGLPKGLEAELRELYDQTLADQDAAEKRRQANKKQPKTVNAPAEPEAPAA